MKTPTLQKLLDATIMVGWIYMDCSKPELTNKDLSFMCFIMMTYIMVQKYLTMGLYDAIRDKRDQEK